MLYICSTFAASIGFQLEDLKGAANESRGVEPELKLEIAGLRDPTRIDVIARRRLGLTDRCRRKCRNTMNRYGAEVAAHGTCGANSRAAKSPDRRWRFPTQKFSPLPLSFRPERLPTEFDLCDKTASTSVCSSSPVVVFLWMTAVFGRLTYLQLFLHSEYLPRALRQQQRTIEISTRTRSDLRPE